MTTNDVIVTSSTTLRMASTSRKFRFSIDRGGTFTDIYAEVPGEPGYCVYKLLSVDKYHYEDAPREGIRRILEKYTGKSIPKNCVDTSEIEWIRMGTTVATNALLERKGVRVLLVTTTGYRDVLFIGNQSRPKIFDLEMARPDVLYEQVVEVEERVRVVGQWELEKNPDTSKFVKGVTGEWLEILQKPNLEALEPQLRAARAAGIESAAVVLMHSFTYPKHEEEVAELLKKVGFTQVSLSSGTLPMKKIVPRGQTACVDAYLTPLIREYVQGFAKGFDNGFHNVKVYFMMSDGGLCPVDQFQGFKAILSGPAGGVVGFAMTTFDKQTKQPVIGFDMGGTSTDVSRFAGQYEHVYDAEVAAVTIQAPKLDITTVAAGGGSRLFFRNGLFMVGPESAGADPGPVCYRKGGPLAITDANVHLGRVVPEFFPKIFGQDEKQMLDAGAVEREFAKLTAQINSHLKALEKGSAELSVDDVAYGFVKVANESMCRPIRSITEAKGYDASDHVLACFGGAGGQHACAIARSLGMRTIFIHRFAGVLSAYGLGLSSLVAEEQQPCAVIYSEKAVSELQPRIDSMKKSIISKLSREGISAAEVETEVYLNLRYEGTDTNMMTLQPDANGKHKGDYSLAFKEEYKREFGFIMTNRNILVDDVRVRGVGGASKLRNFPSPVTSSTATQPKPLSYANTFFEGGRVQTPLFKLDQLLPGNTILGPAIIIDVNNTIVIEPDCTAEITDSGNVRIRIGNRPPRKIDTTLEPVLLSVFSNRFMSIAEQMGKTLQRTAISTNIKERLDFSCALFGPDGGLVANAPHLPVHLGSMQEAVRWQIQHLGDDWHEGEVLVSNHPVAGGSHLPDITVITPVFEKGGQKPVFFVASRGHHADIGGISPGSMPPFSKYLLEEGACIKSFKLVREGQFQEKGITDLLMEPANWKLPNAKASANSGTRNLKDNLSDLRAQVAANQKGIQLVSDLILHYSLEVVHAYMNHVQRNAEKAVRDMLKALHHSRKLQHGQVLRAIDYMDDGTPIQLDLLINEKEGSALFDFSGTGPEVFGNCNAPKSVTFSAILYCLRCLVREDIPLNQGCLSPITVRIPPNSILSPSEEAAVVGGNVLTSQRVTDVVLMAFGACANSQGCMNNLTFGDATMGYYETIAGGGGAGPTWHGQHGIHSHMTNTRITDAEILELRYPVLLREFSLRKNSGGDGKYRGGDGVVREIEFLRPLSVGILSERRAFAPHGIEGGSDGARGINYLIKSKPTSTEKRILTLGGKNTVDADARDRIRILTPGGGGYGHK